MNQTCNNHLLIKQIKTPTSMSYDKKFNKTIDSPLGLSLTLLKYKNTEQRIKERCWELLTNNIISNYKSKTGTRINNFGIFTFMIPDNSYKDDNTSLNIIPIFLINENFVNNIKPGIYDKKKGLVEFVDKKLLINNNIEILDVDYEKLSKKLNISKEIFENNISNIICDIKGKIKQEIFNAKKMEGLGILLKRGNIFGMRFDNNYGNDINEIKNKYNLQSIKIRLRKNINKLNQIKNKHKNHNDLIVQNRYNTNFFFNSPSINGNKLKIKEYNNIKSNNDLYKNINLTDNNEKIDKVKNTLRNFTLLKLKNLKLDNKILENICNKKEILIKKIKEENNNNDIIKKEKFINYFLIFHTSLDNETINKMINIYINRNNDNINNDIEYNAIINQLCNDAQKIIENSKYMTINKKMNSLQNQNKNQISNKFKDKPNYKSNILPNIKIIDNNKTKDNFLNQNELYKIKKIISTYCKEKYTNLITYREFYNLLNKNNINANIIEKLFEFKNMNNDQLIDLTECILLINKRIKRKISKELSSSLNKINIDTRKERLYITNNYINSFNNRQRNEFNSLLLTDNFFTLSQDNDLYSLNNNSLKDNDIKINHINNNEELKLK